jgi:hypothetical protein
LDILEATFQQHRYPSVGIVDDLVEQLNLPTQKITVLLNEIQIIYYPRLHICLGMVSKSSSTFKKNSTKT